MFKNKLLNIMLIILLVLTLLGGVTIATLTFISKDEAKPSEPSIDEIIERTVDLAEMTTNLKDDSFVVFSLKLQTNDKEAQEELTKRLFQVKNILIREFSSIPSTSFSSKEGLQEVENLVKLRVNEIMQNGTVEEVYFTNCIIQ